MVIKKKIGLIIGSGELATYCMEQLVLLGYETTIVSLPCSKVKIKKNTCHTIQKQKNATQAITHHMLHGDVQMKNSILYPIII